MGRTERQGKKMLLTRTVTTSWNSRNKDYYISKGYEKPEKMKTPLVVKIEDLAKDSKIKIDVECDICHKTYHPSFGNYNKRKLGMDLCNACAHKYFTGDIISKSKAKNSAYSLKEYCEKFIDEDFMTNLWSNKNDVDPSELSYK